MDSVPIFSVTELTQHIKGLLDRDETLSNVVVAGEISNLKYHSSGHIYLTLKDSGAVLRAVMLKYNAVGLAFRLADGLKVFARGRVSVFPAGGQHQLYVESIQPDGIGALYMAFEQLKNRLGEEGLFDPAHKKPLPAYPKRIALITSPTGAAVRDMLRILGNRYPLARIRIFPVRVQGTEAPPEICQAIEFANRFRIADLLIVGRGGGSIEDLWSFNDENVARAIYNSEIPIISGVGHEPDFTIADFVADCRAATPSNAAEIAVPDANDVRAQMEAMRLSMIQAMRGTLVRKSEAFHALARSRALQSPENTFQDRRMLLAHTTDRLNAAMTNALARKREQYLRDTSKLDAMSPLKVLSRGYAFAQDEAGGIVTDASALHAGDRLSLTLSRGQAKVRVEEATVSDDE